MEYPEKALIWHDRAIKKGCLYSKLNDKVIREELIE